MKVSFDSAINPTPASTPPSDEAVPAPQTAPTKPAAATQLVPVDSNSQIVPDSFFANDGMEGDFDRSDISLPRFQLVHNTGSLNENFAPGNFVYNKEVDFGKGPHEVTVVRIKKYYQQVLPWGSEEIPLIFNQAEEFRKAGAYLASEIRAMGDAGKGLMTVEPVLDLQVVVKGKPEMTTLPFEFQGVPYALALWTVRGVAYTRVAKPVITAAQFGLRKGLTGAHWTITTKRETFGQNNVWVPAARQGGRNSDEFQAWIKEIANS